MPNVWAIRTGLWSTGSTWNTGTVPTASDDVFISGSNLTVTVDQDVTVRSIGTRSTGSVISNTSTFLISGSRTINGNIIAGRGNNAVTISGTGATVNINGNITGSGEAGAGSNINAVTITGISNTINVSGSVTTVGIVAQSNHYGINIAGLSNTVNVTGNVVGGSVSTTNPWAIFLTGISPTLNVLGSVTGSAGGAITMGPGVPNASISIIGNIISIGQSALVLDRGNALPYTASIVGNILTSASSLNAALSLQNTGLATITITGSISTLSTTQPGINIGSNNNNLTLNISGSITGGPSAAIYGIALAGNFNTVNISGSVTGGTNATARGINNSTNSTVTLNGLAIATIAPAINNTSTGQVIVGTAIATTSSAAISNTGTTPVFYESATFATNGVIPISGRAQLRLNDNNFFSCSLDTGGYKTLINVNNISNGLPAASDVRRGTTYNFGDGVGTMAVPSASYVDSGVAVDNTVGTAVYTTASLATTVWDTSVATLTGSNSVGERLRNISTVSSTGDQLVALL